MNTVNEKMWSYILSELSEPFAPEQVKFLPQSNKFAAYVDARTVSDRLDAVVGPGNWSDSYRVVEVTDVTKVDITPADAPKNKWGKPTPVYRYDEVHYGGVECTLTIFGVSKVDVGSPSNAEQLKGAYSDALKRAAVKFGVGKYLYDLGFFTERDPELPDWALPGANVDADSMIFDLYTKAMEIDPAVAMKAITSYHPKLSKAEKRNIYLALKGVVKA